jgi:hypothetical protein
MTKVAKLLTILMVILLLLPVAKIHMKEEAMGMKVELKEYMNHFSVALGFDQTLKVEIIGEVEKSKPDMSGSFIALLSLALIMCSAVFVNVLDTGDDKFHLISMSLYLGIFILLILLPGAVKNLEFDGESIADGLGKDYVKMTFFYITSLLSSLAVAGIFAKNKFLGRDD